jgi:hypothetical protein
VIAGGFVALPRGFSDDARLAVVADAARAGVAEVVGVFAFVWEHAERHAGSAAGLDPRLIASRYRMPPQRVRAILAAILEELADAAGRLVDWLRLHPPAPARGYSMTPEAQRQRRRRARSPQFELGFAAGVTSGPDNVTSGVTSPRDIAPDRDREKAREEGGAPAPASTLVDEVDADFAEWWAACDNRVGEREARAAYRRARQRGAAAAALRDGWARYAAAMRDSRWINPARWLDEDRWKDRPAPPNIVQIEERRDARHRATGSAGRAGSHASFAAGSALFRAAVCDQLEFHRPPGGPDPDGGPVVAAAGAGR